ncbi:twin arginine-targeting protein translocase TatB [Croceicoccus estronivorus]|uniref:Sec-independent protein translocase protein TatB n=1 Tax=Croceicoccus estronivorus TaxID=1172626 RepID=UPI0008345E13|nr:Sec-independent protein translocase protein TatB [Croceicoccus estronivorus]OCC25226.1 twin arginine-targeting protein translocase TatB [Croceicoccus estronivorus]
MFDIGASELLLIVIVAVVVIGPKDMPLALRTAGRWIGRIRRVSSHFRAGIETMIREAEMEEMEKKWREQNEQIMAAHPGAEMQPLPPSKTPAGSENETSPATDGTPVAEAGADGPVEGQNASRQPAAEPQLPFGGTRSRGEP